jgi:ankyrin repeat protein
MGEPAIDPLKPPSYSHRVSRELSHAPIMSAWIGISLASLVLTFCATASGDQIHTAAEKGDLAAVKALLKDHPDLVSSRGTNDFTPLHVAATVGQVRVAKLLLANKPDVNSKAASERRPLALARAKYSTNQYAFRLEQVTPLHLAAWEGRRDVVKLLLASKADIEARDFTGTTPLGLAVACGHKGVVELLLARHADVNATDPHVHWTPLHVAAQMEQDTVAEILLAKGANPNARGISIGTPLHVAAAYDSTRMVRLLLAHKTDVNAKGHHGATPIFSATGCGHRGVMELLLANKADINARDDSGRTALGWLTYLSGPEGTKLAVLIPRSRENEIDWLRQHGGHERSAPRGKEAPSDRVEVLDARISAGRLGADA